MKTIRLGDIATVELSNVNKKSKDGEKTVKLCNFMDVYNNWAITNKIEPELMIATASDAQIDKFSIKKGQVALTKDSEKRNDIGISTYIADDIEDCILGYHCALITPNSKELNGAYLNALFHTNYSLKYFRDKASGSGQRFTLTKELIEDFPVYIPNTIEEQNQIAAMLTNIDRKIELNDSICSVLESIAKQIYDYWFIQFDFPDNNGNPYKSSGGKMEWCDKLNRHIPEGWTLSTIGQLESNIITGKTPSTKDSSNFGKDIPFITIDDIRDNMFITHTSRKLSEEGASKQANKYLPSGALCVSCIATVGLVGFTTRQSQTNQQINSIIFEKSFNRPFFFFAIKQCFEITAGAKTGNTFANMNKDDFSNLPILYNEATAKLFYSKVNNIFKELENRSEENQKLIELRDFLLPLLMNGQINL